jgi:hypothetical protein
VYVIRDREGNYISPKQTKKGWYFLIYSGRTTGFTFYNENGKLTVKQELKALNDLGNNFYLDSVEFDSIPKGELIVKNTYKRKRNLF